MQGTGGAGYRRYRIEEIEGVRLGLNLHLKGAPETRYRICRIQEMQDIG